MSQSAWERVVGGAWSWDANKEEEVIRLWHAGLSAGQIGEAIGCNKNQVLGKVHRLKLPARKLHPALERAARQRALEPPRPKLKPLPPLLHVTTPAQAKPQEPVLPLRTPRIPPSLRLPVPVGNLPPAKSCQWTDSDRRPWVFCCAPTVPGRSWCAGHNVRVWQAS